MSTLATRETVAYLSNEDSPTIRNPIHSTAGGSQFGFKGPLVGGVTVYGWASDVVLETLGQDWLKLGWAEIAFKQPVYPGDALVIELDEDGAAGMALRVLGPDQAARIEGRVGLGLAPWFSELSEPRTLEPEVHPITHRKLTLSDAPVGEFLLPVPMEMSPEQAVSYAVEKQRSQNQQFVGPRPLLHPAMIAGFETMMVYGQFEFSPGIHVSSQVQHLTQAEAAEGYVATGKMLEAHEKRSRHYATVDGSLIRDGVEYARARQVLIFAIES